MTGHRASARMKDSRRSGAAFPGSVLMRPRSISAAVKVITATLPRRFTEHTDQQSFMEGRGDLFVRCPCSESSNGSAITTTFQPYAAAIVPPVPTTIPTLTCSITPQAVACSSDILTPPSSLFLQFQASSCRYAPIHAIALCHVANVRINFAQAWLQSSGRNCMLGPLRRQVLRPLRGRNCLD